jgi:hypothetical protein
MKYACQYAIVRFMPFVETGEFANVGIVLMCPETGYFSFQLLNRVRRITAFFDQLEARIYREAKNDLRDELNRVKALITRANVQGYRTARFIFQELVRPREVMLRFDAPRVVMADDPEKKLEQLFSFYVERDFVTAEYIEQRLETRLRGILVEACLREEYQESRVEHGAFHARFPFAHKDEAGVITKAMKALHLAHKDPAHAYDHGWTWVGKIRQLKKHQALPDQVLIATQGPDDSNSEAVSVYQEIQDDFRRLDVKVVSLSDAPAIKEFARIN